MSPLPHPEYQQGFHEMVMLFQLMAEHDHETFWLFQFFLQKMVRAGPELRAHLPATPQTPPPPGGQAGNGSPGSFLQPRNSPLGPRGAWAGNTYPSEFIGGGGELCVLQALELRLEGCPGSSSHQTLKECNWPVPGMAASSWHSTPLPTGLCSHRPSMAPRRLQNKIR